MLKNLIVGLLATALVAFIYIFAIGYFLAKMTAIENGAILDYRLRLIGVTEAQPSGLHYSVTLILSLLLVFPYLVMTILKVPSTRTALLSLSLASILFTILLASVLLIPLETTRNGNFGKTNIIATALQHTTQTSLVYLVAGLMLFNAVLALKKSKKVCHETVNN